MIDKKTPAGGNRRAGAKLDIAGPVSARQYITSPAENNPQNTTEPGVKTLALAGVEFTLPQRGMKKVVTTGWPSFRPDLATVARHLAGGGNLGVHVTGYTDGRTLACFDADDAVGLAALLTVAPELENSLRSWRESGSGKILAWVDDPDGRLHPQSTPNLAGTHSKRELLTHGMATINGVHPSGQAYETNWLQPITLKFERLRAICVAWMGQPWKETKPAREKAEPGRGYTRNDGGDVERVKAAWTPSAVFAHLWPGATLVKERNGQIRITGRNGLLCKDGEGVWYSHGDRTGGDVFNAWAYADERNIDTEFPAILAEMAAAKGITLTPRPTRRDGDAGGGAEPDTRGRAGDGGIVGQINRLRLRLRSLDFAEIVPMELQSAKGYRTGDRDRVVADSALGYLWELRTLEARISNLELSIRTGYSPNACGAAMRRLVNIFQPVDTPTDERSKEANRYRICVHCDTNNSVEDVSQCTQLPLATHRGHDVFVRSLSALTPEQLTEKDNKRLANAKTHQAEMDAATTPGERDAIHESYKKRGIPISPIQRNRQLAARLAALADALGPGALRLVDALTMYGPMNRAGLGAVLHKSPSGISRLVVKALGAGLVEDGEDGRVILADDWQTTVDELDQVVPTAGTLARRALAAVDSRLRYCEAAIPTTRDFAEAEKLRKREQRAKDEKWKLIQEDVARYNERMAAAGHDVLTMDVALKAGRGETFADWQRQRAMDGQAGDLALRTFAKTLAGLDRQTAEQTAYYAGWSAYDFGKAWALQAFV